MEAEESPPVDVAALVTAHQSKAQHEARRLIRGHGLLITFQDAEALAMEGLFKAAQRYDSTTNVKFWTFARWHVRGAIIDEVRSTTRKGGGPSRARYNALRAHQLLESTAITASSDRPPPPQSTGDTAAQIDTVAAALLSQITGTLDAFAVALELEQQSSGNQRLDPEEQVLAHERVGRLREALPRLPPEQRHLLEQHFYGERTLTELAAEMGRDKATVSRRCAEALAMLRDLIEDEDR